MERIHRIFQNSNPNLKAFLDRVGILHDYEESMIGATIFLLISESHSKWPLLAKFLSEHDIPETAEIRFSKQEIRDATWCSLGTTSHFGYPQPEDDFGYTRITYSPSEGCDRCGIGRRQVAPFRFRKIPTQKRSQLLQLNWVFDEFFVATDARSQLEDARFSGFEFEIPLLHKSGEPVPGWFQLQITGMLPECVVTSGLTTERCDLCSQMKYNHPQGEMIRIASPLPVSTPDIIKTSEWFGSGGSAHRLVLVSQRFVRLILERGWRGVYLEPVAA